MTPGSGTPVSTIPANLIETGCVDLDDPSQPAEGLVPYGVSAQLWSDGAEKRRWMAVPDGEVVTVDAEHQLQFPVGTVLVKSFSRDGQRLETRLMVHHDEDGWAGYSYAWSPDGTTATYSQEGSAIPVPQRTLAGTVDRPVHAVPHTGLRADPGARARTTDGAVEYGRAASRISSPR